MAKRFTDNEKWTKNKWFRKLPNDYKILWLFILDNCDNVGVWEEDVDFFNSLLGTEITAAAAQKNFEKQIQLVDNGRKWWVKKFCLFQYGELKEENIKNKPHQRYIADLKNHRLWIDYTKTIHSLEEKDKEKEKEEEQEEDVLIDENLLKTVEENWIAFFKEKENKQRHLIGKKEKEEMLLLTRAIQSEFTGIAGPPVPHRVKQYLQAHYKPKKSLYDQDAELPEITLKAAELKQAANGLDFSETYIQNQWKAFLAERNNDSAAKKEHYQTIDDLTSYFLNWLPKQKSSYNGTYKPTPKTGSKSAGAAKLVEMLRNDLTSGTNP